MPDRLTLALLYGGKSGEHEISLISAASVLSNLDPSRFHVIPVGVDKEGFYFINQYEDLLSYGSPLPVKTNHSMPLPSLLTDGKFAIQADVIFPMMHGPLYEDGCLQGLLELGDIAYVGCGVLSSAIGMDKDIARRIACTGDVRSTRYRLLPWHIQGQDLHQFCADIANEYQWPLFVKPCAMGSSVGIHKISNMDELLTAIDDARRYDEEVLIEEGIHGREIELAVLENNLDPASPKVSIAGEIRVNHQDGFYSYNAKYLQSEKTDLLVPAELNDSLAKRLQHAAADIFVRLKCKGMARVDFFVDEKKDRIYFNEINTLPGFTSISMYPKLWQASGISYQSLLSELVDNALLHHKRRQQLKTSY
ncbi:D-alanine--D-alanine ligase family protein [Legionella londiniensis]|uniref:D-alanine--D-alanine ligase n=1 Tax=Legionella londiniensis TaxID=45068 RepID=A0A0W0VRW0_9GAMM|nr:D-alanine--D-alanine ligase family protein [Legionella londiniensis]KTD22717.1 D-alanine--D-alanine ligase [Legionella londiniensis]STX92454.1 D-alanine--D-alanine ligase [Legionella londiniensis]